MEARKLTAKQAQEMCIVADSCFKSKKYLGAFKRYQKLHKFAEDRHVYHRLYYRINMLFCQYHLKTLSWQRIINIANELTNELDALPKTIISVNQESHNAILGNLRNLLKRLELYERKKKYMMSAARLAIKRVSQDTFSNYLLMMEVSPKSPTFEMDYLDALYLELKRSGMDASLQSELMEAAADAYRFNAADVEDNVGKARYLTSAIERYNVALSIWRGKRSDNGGHLLLPMMAALEDLYDLTEEKEAKKNLHKQVCDILASDELKVLMQTAPDKTEMQMLEDEIQEHREWLEQIDKTLMPPPTKKRRIGADRYASPTTVDTTDTSGGELVSSPNRYMQ